MTNKNSIAIIGAGGHGKIVAEIAELVGYEKIEFFDDSYPELTELSHWKITAKVADSPTDSFCAFGNNHLRAKVFLSQNIEAAPILVHPSATLSRYVTLGQGTLVAANAAVNAFTKIAQGVIINTGCTIDHDCEIGDFAHISPGANLAGTVKVGRNSWIGIGASVRENIKIGNDAIIGAGAVVVSDVSDGDCVIGNPARKRK